jgi:hypothetical protein
MSLLALPRHFSTIEPSNAPVLRSVHGLRVVIGRKRGLSLIPLRGHRQETWSVPNSPQSYAKATISGTSPIAHSHASRLRRPLRLESHKVATTTYPAMGAARHRALFLTSSGTCVGDLVMRWTQAAKVRAEQALIQGFGAFDRSVAERGFWSGAYGTYVRALLGQHGERGSQAPDLRYTLFGLAGALRAYRQAQHGNHANLHSAATAAISAINSETPIDSLYYGGLWALAEVATTFADQAALEHADALFADTRQAFLNSTDLNFGVGLFALSLLARLLPENASLRDSIAVKAKSLASVIDHRGLPLTGDRRAAYHQRLMYVTWGLLGAATILDDTDFADAARRILDGVVQRRIDEDGGIRWHALVEWHSSHSRFPRFHPYGADLYYECHQCFYLIALQLMQPFHPIDDARRADAVLKWIFGENRWSLDLTQHGVAGLPVRCVARSGRAAPPLNRFKGCYEVGAFLWQMSNVVTDCGAA